MSDKTELSSKIKSMKFMKRKEDAEDRKKEEAQQRALAEQGHWRLTLPSSVSKPKFRVEYDSTLQSGSLTANVSNARHTFGKVQKSKALPSFMEEDTTSNNDATTKDATNKRPRE